MRNLKRVLSLALALVMVLGMMVITTSAAAYTDAEEITYTEAVEVMSAIGILNGNPDGSFNPKGTLTRQEAAKILAYVCLGADAEEYLTGSAAAFEDVAADKWSAKYVAYCKNLGIINGVNTEQTLFNPTGTLKVVEFAKMLLVAAGIDGEYTGANWANNVKTMAGKTEMKNTGIKITNAEITREEACALALAAMKSGSTTTVAYVVYQDATATGNVGERDNGELVYGSFENPADAYILAGNLPNGAVSIETDTAGTLLKDTHKVNFYATGVNAADAFGNPGVRYVKLNSEGKKVINLFYGEEADLTYTTDKNTVAGKKAIIADLKAQGVEFIEDSSLSEGNYRFSTGLNATVDGKAGAIACNSTNRLAELTGENAIVKVYIEDETVALITVENTYATTVKSVTEANAAKEIEASITLTAGNLTYKTDKFEKDDVVLYTKAWDATKSAYAVQTVVEAEAVTGTLTSYTKAGKYTIDGEVYELSGIALSGASDVVNAYGEEMVYSLDANGKIVAVAEPGKAPTVAPVITDYAKVLDAYAVVKSESVTWPAPATTYEFTAQIKVLLSNGTTEIWDVPVAQADKDIKNAAGTVVVAEDEYYYYLGSKVPTAVVLTGTDATDSTVLTAALKGATGLYTYADKALVAPVTTFTGNETEDATVYLNNGSDLDKGTYTFNGVILNDKTVFVLKELKADGSFKGYTVKTGLAALENTTITARFDAVVDVTAGVDENGDPDTSKNVKVATVIFAETTAFQADTSVNTTDEYALVDGDYSVTVSGTDVYRTYAVTYADGTTGTVVVKNEAGTGMATGAYKLKADGSIDNTTGVTATKTVKLVSGTTVIFTDGTAMTTNAKTVIVGGELAAEAEAYVVGSGAIAIAFIVE